MVECRLMELGEVNMSSVDEEPASSRVPNFGSTANSGEKMVAQGRTACHSKMWVVFGTAFQMARAAAQLGLMRKCSTSAFPEMPLTMMNFLARDAHRQLIVPS